MAHIANVAAYILKIAGPMTAMKLQKLCYYSQAWHLVWDETPLFSSRIEAWANGPVIPDLYDLHRGTFTLGKDGIPGDPDELDASERGTIDEVIRFYGGMGAHELSELTHREDPWRDARAAAGVTAMQRSNITISTASMHQYYDGLTTADAE